MITVLVCYTYNTSNGSGGGNGHIFLTMDALTQDALSGAPDLIAKHLKNAGVRVKHNTVVFTSITKMDDPEL